MKSIRTMMQQSIAYWLLGMAILLCPLSTTAQTDEAPTGPEAFEFMAEYLSRGTGQWRAEIEQREGGPDAIGLWFERTTRGRLLELTVMIFYGDDKRKGLKGYWFWHPGREEIVYQEVVPSGKVRTGTSEFTDNKTFVTLTEAVTKDGEVSSNRGVNVFTSEDEHFTAAYALDENGEWVEQQSLSWKRETERIKP